MSTLLYLSDGYLAAMAVWLLLLVVAPVLAIRARRRRRSAGKSLRVVHAGLMGWLLLLLLTLPEMYCALFYDTTDSFGLTNVSLRWYEMHVATNGAGYRDAEELTERLPAGRKRVCFVGDSFTFGHGVPAVVDRFSDLLGAELERAQPGEYAVANVSLPGLDVRLLVDRLLPELIAQNVRMDVVVYTFVLNDIEYFDERTGAHYQEVEAARPEFFLFRDSYFYNLLYYRLQGVRRPAVGDYYSYLAESYRGEPWERLRRKLDELVALCAANELDLRVAVFPFLHNLGEGYPFAEAHEKVVEYFASRGVPCLDLQGVMEAHAGEGLIVNRFDAHPNERAHAVAAEAMREGLLGDLFGGLRIAQ